MVLPLDLDDRNRFLERVTDVVALSRADFDAALAAALDDGGLPALSRSASRSGSGPPRSRARPTTRRRSG